MNIEGAMFGSAFIQNGGDATIQSFYPNEILRYWNSTKEFKDYAENFASRFREDFPEHYDFLNSLKLYHDTPEALFVHAAVNSHLALEEQTKFTLIWADDNRNAFFARIKTKPWSKLVVHAHTPIPRNEVLSNLPVRINVDTGAAKGRALTCVKLNSTEPAKSDIIQIDISSLRIKC
jgi:serine/threonine protein phosphatase 1